VHPQTSQYLSQYQVQNAFQEAQQQEEHHQEATEEEGTYDAIIL
jgi:hypothetical protein